MMLVLATACGEGETAAPSSPSSSAAAPTTSPATGTGRTVVPDVVVRDVASGADVNVRAAAARPDRPTLYWFWAPH